MKRLIDSHLGAWKEKRSRKPLLMRGARQIGKTFSVRELGRQFDSFVEVNFELLPEAKTIFEKDLEPKRILWELGLLKETEIVPGKTLLFLDEVQVAPKAITALRYFYELMPELHVVAAGSLIDFAVEQVGMPVGRVEMLYVYPLSFMEFLAATGNRLLLEAVVKGESLSEVIHDKLLELLRAYMAVGGMPEAVHEWVETHDPKECASVQKSLIETYAQDFPRYAKRHQLPLLGLLFEQIPHFLGKQFKYASVHGEYKKRELAPCFHLLRHAGVVHQVYHTAGNGVPLGAEVNLERFKTIFLDVGLSQSLLGLDLPSWFLSPSQEVINRGYLAEAFVGQELLAYSSPYTRSDLYYWKRERSGSLAEVDYLTTDQAQVLPIEVKSGHGSTLRSLHQFLSTHNCPKGLRFWSNNYLPTETIDSRPLYAVATLAHPDQRDALLKL